MKKILFAVFVLFAAFSLWAAAPANVNQKVLTAFKQTFGEVSNVSWTETAEFVEARFAQNDIQLNVFYDLDGNVLKTIRYYQGKHLPVLVLSRIASRFPGKKVFGVTEESNDQGVVYHIVLEDATTWTNIDANSTGNISVQHKYRKA